MKNHHPNTIYALLWIDRESEKEISNILKNKCKINEDSIERGMHLTIYHARRKIPELKKSISFHKIKANIDETRFMVFAPGGENPKKNIIPSERSVGIRLTKRNIAIPKILELRRSFYKYENDLVLKGRKQKTTDWKNAFGSSHFQVHIKLN